MTAPTKEDSGKRHRVSTVEGHTGVHRKRDTCLSGPQRGEERLCGQCDLIPGGHTGTKWSQGRSFRDRSLCQCLQDSTTPRVEVTSLTSVISQTSSGTPPSSVRTAQDPLGCKDLPDARPLFWTTPPVLGTDLAGARPLSWSTPPVLTPNFRPLRSPHETPNDLW